MTPRYEHFTSAVLGIGIALAVCIALSVCVRWRSRLHRNYLCWSCGYDLRGLEEATCPECCAGAELTKMQRWSVELTGTFRGDTRSRELRSARHWVSRHLQIALYAIYFVIGGFVGEPGGNYIYSLLLPFFLFGAMAMYFPLGSYLILTMIPGLVSLSMARDRAMGFLFTRSMVYLLVLSGGMTISAFALFVLNGGLAVT